MRLLGSRSISCTLLSTLALACAPSSPSAPEQTVQRAAPTAPERADAPPAPNEPEHETKQAIDEPMPDSAAAAEPMHNAPAPAPIESERSQSRLDIAVPSINGGLNRDIIRRIASSHADDIRDCHGRALASLPGLTGELVVELSIDERGRVTNASLDGDAAMTTRLGECVMTLVMGWTFPDAGGKGSFELELDFSNE
jgi:outer membrane biosynthesis protein TonB